MTITYKRSISIKKCRFFLEILGSARRSLETLPARRTAVPARCTWSVDGPSAQEHPQTPPTPGDRSANVTRPSQDADTDRWGSGIWPQGRHTSPAASSGDPGARLRSSPVWVRILRGSRHVRGPISRYSGSLEVFLGTRTIYAPRTTRWHRRTARWNRF